MGGESFGSLVAQLRRTEADGHQPEQLLSRAVRAGGLDDAKDPAAVLTARLAKLTAARSGGTRRRRRSRYVAGLIPEARGPMPADMHRTLTELQALIEKRAAALASQAIQADQPWVRRLGPPPTNPGRPAAWEQEVLAIATYRDRHHITGIPVSVVRLLRVRHQEKVLLRDWQRTDTADPEGKRVDVGVPAAQAS